jgi:hypothetical protein
MAIHEKQGSKLNTSILFLLFFFFIISNLLLYYWIFFFFLGGSAIGFLCNDTTLSNNHTTVHVLWNRAIPKVLSKPVTCCLFCFYNKPVACSSTQLDSPYSMVHTALLFKCCTIIDVREWLERVGDNHHVIATQQLWEEGQYHNLLHLEFLSRIFFFSFFFTLTLHMTLWMFNYFLSVYM